VWVHLIGENIGNSVNAQFLRGGVPREIAIAIGERGGLR
jgi:hypothetical protein